MVSLGIIGNLLNSLGVRKRLMGGIQLLGRDRDVLVAEWRELRKCRGVDE